MRDNDKQFIAPRLAYILFALYYSRSLLVSASIGLGKINNDTFCNLQAFAPLV